MKYYFCLLVLILFPFLLLSQNTVTNRNGKEFSVGSNFYLSGGTTDAAVDKTNAIYRTGSVGIGSSTPSSPLVVQGITGNGVLKLIAPSVAAGDNWWMGFGHGTTSTDANDRARIGVDILGGGSGRLFFTTGASSAQTRAMFIDESQRVGIGTSSPANKLEITHGTAGNSGLRFTNLTSSSTAATSLSKVLALNSTGDVILTNVPGTQNIVAFSTLTPTASGVVFTPNTPVDQSVIYQSSIDNSMWTYNGTTYVTYTPTSSTAWFTSGTTNDAGSSKTSSIYRTGSVGIGTNNPLTSFSNAPNTANFVSSNNSIQSTGGLTWLTSNNGYTSALYNSNNAVGSNGLQVKVANTSSSTIAFEVGQNTTINGTSLPLFNVLGSGNVGIGTNTPTAQLEVATTNTAGALIRRGGNASFTPANLILQKTSGADAATHGAVVSGDFVGRILFSASNGASYPTNGTDIVGYTTGNQSATNNGGGIMFRTVPLNTIAQSIERMKIDHNGNVGIGFVSPATGITAPASILDVSSTSSGVLVPRMTTTQRTAITLTTALKGMLVFDSDVNMFYYNVGTTWSPVNVGTIKTITAAYTLLPEDNGRILDVTSASAITITVPNTLPIGFQVSITQAGAGQVTITGGTGMTVSNRYSATRTSGQWAKAGLEVRTSSSAVLSGDVF